MNIITSTKNPEIKFLRELVKKSETRKSKGVFIAEGIRLVEDIIKSNVYPEKLYITDEILQENSNYLDFEAVIIGNRVLNYISDTKSPQGIIGIFKIPEYSPEDIFKGNPLLLILEDIRDPGNLGTIFRSFEAAGGTGIILLNDCTDLFSPKCIRATMGSVIRLPFIHCGNVEKLKEIIDKNINIYVANMNGKALYSLDYTKPTSYPPVFQSFLQAYKYLR